MELRLTAKALGERALKSKAVSDSLLTELLDQYSERLVSLFDEKLKISLGVNQAGKADGIDEVDDAEDKSEDSSDNDGSNQDARRKGAVTN